MNLNPAVQTAKYAEYAEGHELTIGNMFTPPLRRKTAPAKVFLPLSPRYAGGEREKSMAAVSRCAPIIHERAS